MKTKKILAVVLAVLMVAALFAGCGNTSTNNETPTNNTPATQAPANNTPATQAPANNEPAGNEPAEATDGPIYTEHASKGTVKIGHLLDLTGVEAATGNQAKAAFDFAATHALLIGEYEVEVIERDCQSNSGIAAQAAAELVEQEHVAAIFGPTQIGHKGAVAGYMKESGVPLILYNGTPAGMLMGSPWAIGEGGTTMQLPTTMADYVINELGYTKVYTIRQQTTGGDNYVLPFEEKFTAAGGTVIQSVELPVGGSDYSSLLATFTDPEAQAIVGWTSSADAVNFWSSWYELGLYERLPVVGTMHGGFTDFYIMKQLNNANPAIVQAILDNNTLTTINWCYSIENQQNQEFLEYWRAEKNATPAGNNLPGACWQAIQVLEEALAANGGNTDPEALLSAILEVDFTGPEGHVYFGNGSRAAYKDVNIARVIGLEDNYNYEVVRTYTDVPPTGLE